MAYSNSNCMDYTESSTCNQNPNCEWSNSDKICMDAEGENQQLIVSFVNKFINQCSSSNGKSKTEINELKLLMEYNMNNAKLSTLQLSDLNKKLGENNSGCSEELGKNLNEIWPNIWSQIFIGYDVM